MNQNGNSAAHEEPEIAEESDFLFNQIPTKTEETRVEENAPYGSEFYKRVGFYCAFNAEPEKEFRRSLMNLEDSIHSKIKHLEDEFANDIIRFKDRREEAGIKVDEIKDDLNAYESEASKLESELPNLQEQFELLRQELREIVVNIGTKKESLIKDRQEALLDELNRLNEELEVVVKKRMGINEEIFLKQKDVLDEKRKFWQVLFEKHMAHHRSVLDKLDLFGLSGFHVISSSFLYNIGLISAGIGGAFFASFTEVNQFASGGLLSFVIQSLFTFSMQFIGQDSELGVLDSSKKYVFAGILLFIFLSLIALIFASSWICQVVYTHLFEKRIGENEKKSSAKLPRDEGEYNSSIELSLESQDLPLKTKISEKSFLGFWLKAIPLIMCLAIIFVFVSLGTNSGSLKSLDASVAGYGIGLLLSLASAGVLYIYLTMVIEPRIERHRELRSQNNEVRWRWLNFELLILTVAFIASLLTILIFFQHPFVGIAGTQSLVSLLLFLVCSLITAFTLGFGIRFQSLEVAREFIEINCDIIQTKIIRISRPLQIYLTKRENAQFNARYLEIRNEIMNLILSRTQMTRNAINTPLMKDTGILEKRRLLTSLNKWFRSILSSKNAADEDKKEVPSIRDQGVEIEKDILTASDETKICFPKLEAELSVVEAAAKEVHDKMDGTKREIIFRKEQKGEFYERKLKELAEHELRYRNYHKAITNREKELHNKKTAQTKRKQHLSQKITEGYELGNWFAKNNPTGTVIPEIITEV